MKTFTASTLAGAVMLALAVSAGAQTTSATPSTSANDAGAMRGPSDKANIPDACKNMSGRELGSCLKAHGGASENGRSGTTDMRGNSPMRNDKSGSGSGSVGGATGPAGTAGTTGSGATGASGPGK